MPSGKRRYFAIVLMVVLGLICWKISSHLPVAIQVGRETTYLTEPLDADGVPDYARWWLEWQRSRAGKSNGAIALWQAMWPGDYDQESQELIRAELGPEIPAGPGTFRSYESPEVRDAVCDWLIARWIADQPALAQEESDSLRRQAEDCMDDCIVGLLECPFTAESVPPLADWINSQSATVAHLLRATQSDGWYSPPAVFLRTPAEPVLVMDFGFAESARTAFRVLQARASYQMGNGDFVDAWKCCQAIRSLADACRSEECLVSNLVACALYAECLESTQILVQQPKVDQELLRQIQRDFNQHWSPISLANAIDVGERVMFLDAIGRIAHGRESGILDDDDQETVFIVNLGSVNWNRIMKSANGMYDRMVEGLRKPNWSQRYQALEELSRQIESLQAERHNLKRRIWAFFDPNTRSDMIGEILISLWMPPALAVADIEDRINTHWELTRQAVAIELYRREQGHYPSHLRELVPVYQPSLPVDRFHQAPYAYRKTETGFLLYSYHANGTDDQGSHGRDQVLRGFRLENEFDYESIRRLLANELEALPELSDLSELPPQDADDHAIRFPTPERELPSPAIASAEQSIDVPRGDP